MRHTLSQGAAGDGPRTNQIFVREKLERQWREVIERVESSDELSGQDGTTNEGPGGSEEEHLGEDQVTSLVNEILERFSWPLKPKGAYLYQGAARSGAANLGGGYSGTANPVHGAVGAAHRHLQHRRRSDGSGVERVDRGRVLAAAGGRLPRPVAEVARRLPEGGSGTANAGDR